MNATELKGFIKKRAKELGFEGVGVAKAERLDDAALLLQSWLDEGQHGTMSYMENHFEKRVDPRVLVPGAKTVISFLHNYHQPDLKWVDDQPKIASYAVGRDYHKVLKKKLKILFQEIEEKVGTVNGRIFTDSAPVMERQWAEKSGLGWRGKHTLLIHPQKGSWFFLAEIISDLELEPDSPIRDHCGTCTRCIDACPTDAISPQGYLMDGSKCISYLTIESKESIPKEYKGKIENWAFGCDICQDVCPWNRFAKAHQEPDFQPRADYASLSRKDWDEMTEEQFDKWFFGTPVKRAKYKGLKRNIDFLRK